MSTVFYFPQECRDFIEALDFGCKIECSLSLSKKNRGTVGSTGIFGCVGPGIEKKDSNVIWKDFDNVNKYLKPYVPEPSEIILTIKTDDFIIENYKNCEKIINDIKNTLSENSYIINVKSVSKPRAVKFYPKIKSSTLEILHKLQEISKDFSLEDLVVDKYGNLNEDFVIYEEGDYTYITDSFGEKYCKVKYKEDSIKYIMIELSLEELENPVYKNILVVISRKIREIWQNS